MVTEHTGAETIQGRKYGVSMLGYFFHWKLFSVGSQEEPDLEIQAFKICDTNKDDALTWQEVEDCEVCIY